MSERGARAPAQDWYNLVTETLALRSMTKTELSELSGVPRPTIERWAAGKRTPQAAPVNAVADVLGIDRARALRLAGIIDPAPDAGRPVIPPGLLAQIRRDIAPEDQPRVIEAVRRELSGEPTPPREEAESPSADPGRQAG